MLLSAATKSSLADVLGLVQKTVLNAARILTIPLHLSHFANQASELEDEAQAQVARIGSEAHEARRERDEALKALHAAESEATKHENELSQMRATIEGLQREVVHWKEQAKNWQDHYTRVEVDRCGLSTELLTLSRTALTASPPKQPKSAPSSVVKRDSTSSSNRPPAYKSAIPPSPTEPDSPSQNISTHRNPRTPASKSAKQPASARSELPAYHSENASASSSNENHSVPQSRKTKTNAAQMQTPSQPPRQIFVRRVQAVIHVKEEEGSEVGEFEDEEEEVVPDSVRLVKRRRSGLMIQDDDDDYSASEGEAGDDPRHRQEESGDELTINPRPVQPTPRLKRAANVLPRAEATPAKRRRVSDTARVRVPAKKK
ncbi:hypothetical protein B0H12DRAFT_1108752 [Mycena haematopus]|nr:hypothetical protein B0H12DRAFT_1108752 [Mycena haematopus]